MRTRLFLAFLTVVLAAVFSLVALTTYRVRQDIDRFLYRGGLSGSDLLVEELEVYYARNRSWEGVARAVLHPPGMQGHGPGRARIILLADASGKILYTDPQAGGPAARGYGSPGDVLGEDALVTAIPIYSAGSVVGYLLPEAPVAIGPGIELSLLTRLNRSALVAAGLAALLSLVLAVVLATVLLRPIRELTQAARALSQGDLSRRVRPRGGREIAILAATFNQMASSLQQAEARRNALTADIAHELRNPLAVQRANLEALQDGLYPLTQDNLEPIVQQNQMLERLVEDLRTLALADAGQLSLVRTDTDLVRLLERRIADLAVEAAARAIRFDIDFPDAPVSAHVDPARIGQIVLNLAANALQHTPAGGRVVISLDRGAEQVRIAIRDSGPGIPAEDLPHIFERFYRGDRSRAREQGHTGLGLSIARRLAEAHGGGLTAENHPQGGAVFTLTLPLGAV